MPLFTLTVSLDDLGLDIVADEVVEVTKNRLLLVDAYPPVNNLYKIRELTDGAGLVSFELEPDDDSTFHKITIHDLENVLIYERIFIMPSFTVAIEDTDPSFSSSTIQIKSNGTNVGTPYSVSALNFIGAVLALASGTVTLTITPSSIGADVSGAAATAEQAAKDYADDGLALKLDAADYVQHFLGKYSSLGALQTAHATATDGDYAIVDTGSGSNARQYVWDLQEGWVDSGSSFSVTLAFNFNRGQILGKLDNGIWNPTMLQDYRAGIATSYLLNGVSGANNSASFNVTTVLGTNTLNGSVTYATGQQPKDSKNSNYDNPLPSGTSPIQSTSFEGIYPYFYYKSTSPITPAIMQSAIANGQATKVLASSTGTITIPFAANGEYIAVAYPASSTTKTIWYVNALDNGDIPGGLLGAANTLSCNSPTNLWNNVNFKIHVSSGLITQLNPIQLKNS
jgi:hypothetical protein